MTLASMRTHGTEPEPPSRIASPPPATFISGGNWTNMSRAAREEIWRFHDYLACGGKKVYGSFAAYNKATKSE